VGFFFLLLLFVVVVVLQKIRKHARKNMKSDDLRKRQLGVATWIIDKLALRVGNEKGSDEADTVGCCSLRVEHVQVGVPFENSLLSLELS
jgi:DNA topoisomerase IB